MPLSIAIASGERLEGRTELENAERGAVKPRVRRGRPRRVGVELGSEVIASTSPVWTSITTPAAPIAEKCVMASRSSCFSACWTRLSIERSAALPRVAGSER